MKPEKRVNLVITVFLLLNLFVYICNSVYVSSNKPFWIDEAYVYRETMSTSSFFRTLAVGAKGQFSSAPLDYLILRLVYLCREINRYFGLQPFGYYRLHYPLAVAFVVVTLYIRFVSRKNYKLAIAFVLASTSLMFNRSVYQYSSEMRPYVLLVALGYLYIFSFCEFKHPKFQAFVTILLALTSTASALLIGLFTLAYSLTQFLFWKSNSLEKNPHYIMIMLVSLASIMIDIYYSLYHPIRNPIIPGWEMMIETWVPYLLPLTSGLILMLYYLKSRERCFFLMVTTTVFWLSSAPVYWYITYLNRFYFTPRHLIYLVPAVSVIIFLTVSALLNNKTNNRANMYLKVTSSLLLIPFLLTNTTFGYANAGQNLRSFRVSSIPVSSLNLGKYIPNNIPSEYHYRKTPDEDFASEVNFRVWTDYLDVIYPSSVYQRNKDLVLLGIDSGDNFSVKVEEISMNQYSE